MSRSSRFHHHVGSTLAVALLAALPVAAQDDDADAPTTVLDQIEQMREQLDDVQQENARLRTEVDDLRAVNDDDWLTEQRAEEIRGLVADVLADADTRSSLLQDGLVAGWSDHFFLASPDGRFKLQIDGMIQFRWIFNYHDAPDAFRNGFEVTRSRLTFRGHVFSPAMTYLVRLQHTRDESGLVSGLYFFRDAWIRYQFNNSLGVRVGRFQLPFSREELTSPAYQQGVERTLVNDNLGMGRSDAIELILSGETLKFMGTWDDGGEDRLGNVGLTGITPGVTGFAALIEDVEWSFTGRVEWKPAGNWEQFKQFTSPVGGDFGLLFGLGLHAQNGESTGAFTLGRDETDWYAYTVDGQVQFGGANIYASWFQHYLDTPTLNINVFGFTIQGAIYLAPKWEIFARWQWGEWDISGDLERSDLNVVSAGFNYYIDGQDIKWSTDIGFGIGQVEDVWAQDINGTGGIGGWRIDPEGAEPQIVFRTQIQLLF